MDVYLWLTNCRPWRHNFKFWQLIIVDFSCSIPVFGLNHVLFREVYGIFAKDTAKTISKTVDVTNLRHTKIIKRIHFTESGHRNNFNWECVFCHKIWNLYLSYFLRIELDKNTDCIIYVKCIHRKSIHFYDENINYVSQLFI